MKNVLTLRTLPNLRRTRLSFHYIGGTRKPNIDPTAINVTIKTNEAEPKDFFIAPEDKLFNDGWVANATEWSWQDMALPKVDSGTVVKFISKFDKSEGVVALDNIRVYTNQK